MGWVRTNNNATSSRILKLIFFIIHKLVFKTYAQWSNWEGNTNGRNHFIFLNLHFSYPRKTYAQYISWCIYEKIWTSKYHPFTYFEPFFDHCTHVYERENNTDRMYFLLFNHASYVCFFFFAHKTIYLGAIIAEHPLT